MNRHIQYFLAAIALVIMTSCIKEKLETTYNSQESKIDQYINSKKYVTIDGEKDSLRVVNNNGANRLVLNEGTGESLEKNGTVAFYYAGYTFNGSKSNSNLFITNHEDTAIASGWDLTDPSYEIYKINLGDVELLEGLRKGLLGVKQGEHCEILFSGKYGFGNDAFGIIPANTALLYEIWVEAVSND